MTSAEKKMARDPLTVHPTVVKAVSRLLESYESDKTRDSPTDFLKNAMKSNEQEILQETSHGRNDNYKLKNEVPNPYQKKSHATNAFFGDENELEDKSNRVKRTSSEINDGVKCEYPEICRMIDSVNWNDKLSRRRGDKSVGSSGYDDTSSLESNDKRLSYCECRSDEDESSGIYTPSSTDSSYSDETTENRNNFSTGFVDLSYQGEKSTSNSLSKGEKRAYISSEGYDIDQRDSSKTMLTEKDKSKGLWNDPEVPENNVKNSSETYCRKSRNDNCTMTRMMSSDKSFPNEESDLQKKLQTKRIQEQDEFKQATVKLFLQVLDNDEFIQIIVNDFNKINVHRIPPGFFKVMIYFFFFNLTRENIDGIKKIIIHSYPGKFLEFFNYLKTEEFRLTHKLMLKLYDKDFIKQHAEVYVTGSMVMILRDEVKNFLEIQDATAESRRKGEIERKAIQSLKKTQLNSSDIKKEVAQDKSVSSNAFRAKPPPASTYTAPKTQFLRREKEKADFSKDARSNSATKKNSREDKEHKSPEETKKPDTAMDPLCLGCMEKQAFKGRRQQNYKLYESKGEKNIFSRPENRNMSHHFTTPATRHRKTEDITSNPTMSARHNVTPVPDLDKPEELAPRVDLLPMDTMKRQLKPLPNFNRVSIPVKPTAASVLREGARLRQDELKTMEKLDWLASGGGNWVAWEEMEARAREEAAQEELEALERKHLQGLLTHEEALLARQALLDRQRQNAFVLRQEKEALERQLDEYRMAEEEKIRFIVERTHADQLAAKEKCKEYQKMKTEEVQRFIRENKEQLAEMQRQRQDELCQRIALIREVRALQSLTKQKKREIDFTETAGYGLLYEMSIAELHERLNLLREEIREDIEQKRLRAQNFRAQQKQHVLQTQEYINQQRQMRQPETHFKPMFTRTFAREESPEIQMLRQRLHEARRLRLGFS